MGFRCNDDISVIIYGADSDCIIASKNCQIKITKENGINKTNSQTCKKPIELNPGKSTCFGGEI